MEITFSKMNHVRQKEIGSDKEREKIMKRRKGLS